MCLDITGTVIQATFRFSSSNTNRALARQPLLSLGSCDCPLLFHLELAPVGKLSMTALDYSPCGGSFGSSLVYCGLWRWGGDNRL